MSDAVLINFTELSLDEKTMILEWRNHPSIKKWMHNSQDISLEEHLKFILQLENSSKDYYFLVKKCNEPIGVIDFTSINKHDKSAEIGLYARPTIKGVGKILMDEIVSYGFNELRLKKLFVSVFLENKKALSLYKDYKFTEYARDEKLIYMELNYENRQF